MQRLDRLIDANIIASKAGAQTGRSLQAQIERAAMGLDIPLAYAEVHLARTASVPRLPPLSGCNQLHITGPN
ncbi:MAG: hypothetical protein U0U69_05630 [Acidimicrobiia bacterium]